MAVNLLELQKDLRDLPLIKDAMNPHFKNQYLSLFALQEAIFPVLHKHKVVLMQPLTNINGVPAIKTLVLDTDNGDTIIDLDVPLMVPTNATNPAQALGAAITYTKRYGALSAFGLEADEDDDANAVAPQKDYILTYAKSSSNRKFSGV